MSRGDVWMTDFGPPDGPEQAGVRPAIILQDDELNATQVTTILVPITTKLRRITIPTTVLLQAGEGGLPQDSVALCHQIQVRGKARLLSFLGRLSPQRLTQVEDGVKMALSFSAAPEGLPSV